MRKQQALAKSKADSTSPFNSGENMVIFSAVLDEIYNHDWDIFPVLHIADVCENLSYDNLNTTVVAALFYAASLDLISLRYKFVEGRHVKYLPPEYAGNLGIVSPSLHPITATPLSDEELPAVLDKIQIEFYPGNHLEYNRV